MQGNNVAMVNVAPISKTGTHSRWLSPGNPAKCDRGLLREGPNRPIGTRDWRTDSEGTCPLGVPIRTRVRGVASAFTGGCRCPGNLGADRGIRQPRSCGVEPVQ